MHKFLLAALFTFSCSTLLPAQLGIKAGFNLSYVNGENDLISNRATRIGFQGGIMYKIPVNGGSFSIQPELIYIQKGGEFNIDQLKIDARLGYVEMPILGVYNLLGGVLNFHGGLQFSFLTDVEYTIAEENGPSNNFRDTDLSNYNQFDFGLTLGAGLQLEVVMIELRYSIGFLGVEKGFTYDGQQYNPSSKNFNAQFLVGYFF